MPALVTLRSVCLRPILSSRWWVCPFGREAPLVRNWGTPTSRHRSFSGLWRGVQRLPVLGAATCAQDRRRPAVFPRWRGDSKACWTDVGWRRLRGADPVKAHAAEQSLRGYTALGDDCPYLAMALLTEGLHYGPQHLLACAAIPSIPHGSSRRQLWVVAVPASPRPGRRSPVGGLQRPDRRDSTRVALHAGRRDRLGFRPLRLQAFRRHNGSAIGIKHEFGQGVGVCGLARSQVQVGTRHGAAGPIEIR
jgi:hypothetical protein